MLRATSPRTKSHRRGRRANIQRRNQRAANPSTGGGRAVRKRLALFVTTTAVLGIGVGAVAVAGSGGNGGSGIKERLTGYEENLAISTPGVGTFRAHIDRADETISYRLSFKRIPTEVRQA